MNIKILLIAILAIGLQLGATAMVSVDTTLTEEYMLNNGYSGQMYDSVNVSRARALGQPFYSREELKYKTSNPVARFFKRAHSYIDPAIDDFSFYHHDSTPEPSIDDL